MTEPENVILLKQQSDPSPSTQQLRAQLTQTRKNIKKAQSSIKSKREQLLHLSNSLNKQVQKQLNDRYRHNSYTDLSKIISQYPSLTKKKIQLDTINAQLLKLIDKNNNLKLEKQSGVSQRADAIFNILHTKSAQIEQLKIEKQALVEYNKTLILPEETDQTKQLSKQCEQLRYNTKQLQKDLHSLETQQMMMNAYVSEAKYKLQQYHQAQNNQKHLIDQEIFKNQLNSLEALLSQRNIFNKKAVKDVSTLTTAIEAMDKQNQTILHKIKQIQNSILRQDMQSKARHALTERTHSVGDIKKQVGNKVVSQRLGMVEDTKSSIMVTDKMKTIRQITVFEDQNHNILGIQLGYGDLTGKKMVAVSSQPTKQTTIRLDTVTLFTISYDDTMIHNFKFNKNDNSEIMVGRVNSGIGRLYNLKEQSLQSIAAILDTVNDEPRLVAMVIQSKKKPQKKQLDTEDTVLTEQPKTQISRIHKGSLPKLNSRQIVDHRLMLSHK